jgi:predicted alpha/beta-fold hydrolase
MPFNRPEDFINPLFLANSHLQTVVPNLFRIGFGVRYIRQRIDTLDGDFLDLDWSRVGSKKLMVFSHGLENSSKAPYVVGMVKYFNKRGWDALAWNFRSCSGEMNRAIGFYHPGQTDDFQLVLDQALDAGYEQIALVGFSLGGAITLRYLGEKGGRVHDKIKAAAVFSVPTDLEACARHLSTGTQSLYGKGFLYFYRRKMLMKEKLNPGRYDLTKWDGIQNMMDFDAAFNVDWYGFRDLSHFYGATSSQPLLPRIQIPTLIVNAENDPFLPEDCYPVNEAGANPYLHLEVPEMGGHVGFVTLSWRGVFWSEARAEDFFASLNL